MKKLCFILFFAFLGLSVFAQNAGNGTITEMSGTVELKPAGASGYTPARVGDSVAQDTVVSAGFKSTAVIKVGSATIVVQPITMLTLAEIGQNQGTETVNVNLRAGRVQVDVKPPAGTRASFTVVTPTATASVRGTAFDMDTRNIRVSSGVVRFAARRGGGGGGSEGTVGSEGEGVAGGEGEDAGGSAVADGGGGTVGSAGGSAVAGGNVGVGGRNIYPGGESMINERKSKPSHPVEMKEAALQPKAIQGTESRPESIEIAPPSPDSNLGLGFGFLP